MAELDAYFEAIRPSLAVTPAASEGVRELFLPPMPGWVQVLTPARPAWGTLAVAGLRDAAAVGPADVLAAGLGADRRGGDGRAAGVPDGVARAAERARRSPIVRAGFDRVAETSAA